MSTGKGNFMFTEQAGSTTTLFTWFIKVYKLSATSYGLYKVSLFICEVDGGVLTLLQPSEVQVTYLIKSDDASYQYLTTAVL